jgi:serine protease inhibitor
VTVSRVLGAAPEVHLTCVPFDIRAEHDLLAESETFGLETASAPRRARFPGISRRRVCVGAAGQNTMAQFTAHGFAAAAVTEIFAVPAGGSVPHEVTCTEVSYTRPYGFAAVLRESGLILVAGWVAEPGAGVRE